MQNQKMKELMAKQRIDDARGGTYGAGMSIESDTFQIPQLIKETEAKNKIKLKIDCPWPGCYKWITRRIVPNSANIWVKLMIIYSSRRWRFI